MGRRFKFSMDTKNYDTAKICTIKDIYDPHSKLCIVQMHGAYLVAPENFRVLNDLFVEPKDSQYAGVVVCDPYCAKRLGLVLPEYPHFIFFSDSYPDTSFIASREEEIVSACKSASAFFKTLCEYAADDADMLIDPFLILPVHVFGDPRFSGFNTPSVGYDVPYGAVVVHVK